MDSKKGNDDMASNEPLGHKWKEADFQNREEWIVEYKRVACENIRFSSLFAAGGPAAKSVEKRMFSQANKRGVWARWIKVDLVDPPFRWCHI